MWNKIKDTFRVFKKWGFKETFKFLALTIFYILQALCGVGLVIISFLFLSFISALPYIFILGALTGFIYLLLKAVGIS